MSHNTFALAVKSTIDYYAAQLAQQHGYAYFDLDGAATMADLLESDQAALAWSLTSFSAEPRDPLYYLEFEIGGKTSQDPAQYVSMDIASLVLSLFKTDARLIIKDYSGVQANSAVLGVIHICSSGVSPAQFDRSSNLRLVNVRARVTRSI